MRICMLLHKSVQHDSRVRREADSLAEAGHDVTVVHLPKGETFVRDGATAWSLRSADPPPVLRRLPFHAHRAAFLAMFVAQIRRLRPDVVHAHDAAMLLPALIGARIVGASVVYDSHELATGVAYRNRTWARFVRALEAALVPRCRAVVTVSDGIARALQARYRLGVTPTVVRNVSALQLSEDAPAGRGLRRQLGLSDEEFVVLHQGAAATARGCEQLVLAAAGVDGSHLVFLGDGDPPVERRLRELVAAAGIGERVHFLPGVPLERLLDLTAEADVGVTLLEGTCENHELALPNKLFEYIRARVPVVASDLPEMASIVRTYEVGWTVDPEDPASVAEGLRAARAARDDADLQRRLAAAAEALSWRRERERLVALYAGLAASGG